MGRKQFLVLLGMALASALLVALWLYNPQIPATLPTNEMASRLAFAERWLIVPALTLLVGVAMAANRRFFAADAIDGGTETRSRSLDINLRYNRNTLEQVVLAAVAWTGLALTLPQERLTLIPMLAILFAVGRAAFWIGYLMAPWARAFGFALTFYPTMAAYVWLLLRGF